MMTQPAFRSLSDQDEALIADTVKGANDILEIGSRYGDSSLILAREARKNGGKLYCVECDPQESWRERMDKAGLIDNIVMLEMVSPWVDYTRLPREINYLLIDGDHRTSRAIADFHFFQPLVTKGGFVAFHDTCFKEERCGFMVSRAIDIILEEYPNYEAYKECKGKFGTKVLVKRYEL